MPKQARKSSQTSQIAEPTPPKLSQEICPLTEAELKTININDVVVATCRFVDETLKITFKKYAFNVGLLAILIVLDRDHATPPPPDTVDATGNRSIRGHLGRAPRFSAEARPTV